MIKHDMHCNGDKMAIGKLSDSESRSSRLGSRRNSKSAWKLSKIESIFQMNEASRSVYNHIKVIKGRKEEGFTRAGLRPNMTLPKMLEGSARQGMKRSVQRAYCIDTTMLPPERLTHLFPV